MNFATLSRVWTGTGIVIVAGMWVAVLWAPAWLDRLGWVFLATPIALATLTVWRHTERDRLTMLCLGLLILLFLIAWYV